MEYQSLLHKKLKAGGFIFTAETTPPDASNKEVLLEKTKSLKRLSTICLVMQGCRAQLVKPLPL